MNSEAASLKTHFGEQRLGTHNKSHIVCYHLITQNYSTVTRVTYSHISALFTALWGLSLSKVSNVVPNLRGLPTSFQTQISKHTWD